MCIKSDLELQPIEGSGKFCQLQSSLPRRQGSHDHLSAVMIAGSALAAAQLNPEEIAIDEDDEDNDDPDLLPGNDDIVSGSAAAGAAMAQAHPEDIDIGELEDSDE